MDLIEQKIVDIIDSHRVEILSFPCRNPVFDKEGYIRYVQEHNE